MLHAYLTEQETGISPSVAPEDIRLMVGWTTECFGVYTIGNGTTIEFLSEPSACP
jgi:hypothetical protein